MRHTRRLNIKHEDENVEAMLVMPPDFPLAALHQIAGILEREEVFVPGYIPPAVGLYHPNGFLYENHIEGVRTILLPDLNIVTDLASIAKGAPINGQRRLAAAVLAFAQCLDIWIEPSIAFHEFSPKHNNDVALEKLQWFRLADNGNVLDWVDIALGQKHQMNVGASPPPKEEHNLNYPLSRWRRNYVIVLKIAELELTRTSHLNRMHNLLDWMLNDFIIAGPAALYASVYFAPLSPPRRDMLKHLRSGDRTRAIEGARNAAWDITYLSDFMRRIKDQPDDKTRFIFTTFDKGLRCAAQMLLNQDTTVNLQNDLATSLRNWWPVTDAEAIAERISKCLDKLQDPIRLRSQERSPRDYISRLTSTGENHLLEWCNAHTSNQPNK